MPKLKAYVTGATGCVGYNLVRLLLREEWEVTALCRASSNTSRLSGLPIECRRVDLFDAQSVRDVLPTGIDAVFHVAGNVAYWPDPNQWKDNVLTTRNLVREAQAKHVKRFVFTSTGATLPYHAKADPRTVGRIGSGYIRTKREAEIEVLNAVVSGLDAVIMQPIIVIGRFDFHGHYSKLFREKDLRFALPGSLEFCDAEDVARAHVQAFHHGRRGEHYVLGGSTFRGLSSLA